MGISFMKQYAQSGVDIPVIGPGFVQPDVLPAIGDAALGEEPGPWSQDSTMGVEEVRRTFKVEYGRLPSIYAAQAYDTGLPVPPRRQAS